MKKSTIDYLVKYYNNLINKKANTCLKFRYIFNNISVNIYFDAFYASNISFNIILIHKETNTYYFTPINIFKSKFLPALSPKIQEKIILHKSLNCFYENMENHLLKDTPVIVDYNDACFKHTLNNKKALHVDKPFLSHLSRKHMADKTLNNLFNVTSIPMEVLQKIKDSGYTLVRTVDPSKRKDITLILNRINIKLEEESL